MSDIMWLEASMCGVIVFLGGAWFALLKLVAAVQTLTERQRQMLDGVVCDEGVCRKNHPTPTAKTIRFPELCDLAPLPEYAVLPTTRKRQAPSGKLIAAYMGVIALLVAVATAYDHIRVGG